MSGKEVTLIIDEESAEWIWECVLEAVERNRKGEMEIAGKVLVALGKAGCVEILDKSGEPLTVQRAVEILRAGL